MNKRFIISTLLAAALTLTACSTQKEESPQPLDDVMMQAFYWDVPVDEQAKNGSWWDHLRETAPKLKAAGISSLWTPVPAKGNWGIVDSGYGIYDHYDLGNYKQKGTVETRYGSRAELEQMIGAMHEVGINVYSDVVLNHLYGGDENLEANPVVTDYVKANRGEPYPESDIRWVNSVAHTRTHLFFPKHTGEGEPNYEWHYGHFHPSSANDSLTDFTDDVLRPRTKFFGNDLDTYSEEVQQRLCNWGKWLKGTVGFDGFRLDFVRGLQPEFVSRWVKGLPLQDGKQPFIVCEYWAADGRYIKEWVDNVAAGGADVHAFDFPLKFTLTDMCNKTGDEFDMSQLTHAGMIRNNAGFALPAGNVVTFVDNHDTGKEHDKWLVKDFAMAYAYILTHEGTPCMFYPHFYAVTQYDVDNKSLEVTAPANLQQAIRQLIDIRRQYLGGTLTVLTETGHPEPAGITRHVYVARRQGNGTKDGAIIMLNNHNTDTLSITINVNNDGFTDWSGQTLVNLLNPKQVSTVSSDGSATLTAPNRGYSIWVLQRDVSSDKDI
ncbi:MAG: hypothetical protein J5543_00085 [Bacteroidales bacterium]|nr:hypothetical protein [Bacteroidales bacterium]